MAEAMRKIRDLVEEPSRAMQDKLLERDWIEYSDEDGKAVLTAEGEHRLVMWKRNKINNYANVGRHHAIFVSLAQERAYYIGRPNTYYAGVEADLDYRIIREMILNGTLRWYASEAYWYVPLPGESIPGEQQDDSAELPDVEEGAVCV